MWEWQCVGLHVWVGFGRRLYLSGAPSQLIKQERWFTQLPYVQSTESISYPELSFSLTSMWETSDPGKFCLEGRKYITSA